MKIVILAAGMGTRLGKVEPKPLTALYKEQSILGVQLEYVSRYTSLKNVILVVGYLKEKIIEAFPDIAYIENPLYNSQNTSKSLLLAIKGLDEDVLWINGDVLFYPTVFESLLKLQKTCMVVNKGAVGAEEVKYRSDADGRLLEVSKEVKQGEGEAVGMNYVSRQDLPLFIQNLKACKEQDYFEKGIQLCIQQHMQVDSLIIPRDHSIEIDFQEDLERAQKLIHTWN